MRYNMPALCSQPRLSGGRMGHLQIAHSAGLQFFISGLRGRTIGRSSFFILIKEPNTMKITDIRALRLAVPPREMPTPPRRPSWWQSAEVANPMSRYPRYKAHRDLWLPKWENVWCKVTLEDGTWGLGQTSHGRAV